MQGTPYMVQIVPKIKSLSHNAGSLAGGLQIRIEMDRLLFSSDKITVDIDGANCSITSISEHISLYIVAAWLRELNFLSSKNVPP